jgi:5-methylcytosine-specific restriction endonuclease McrA
MAAQSILLLNASYEPLTAVTLARAVKLLLRGRAEAVSDEHITVASAAETLAVPQVLRLKIYAHVPHRRTPLWTRRGVFERDDFTCARLWRAAGVTPHAILR